MKPAPDFAGVVAMLQDLFDGLYECDTRRFSRVFHPQAQYYCATDGELLHLDMGQYFSIVEKRISPKSQGHVRTDRILSIEFAGPVTAFATAECSIPGKSFTDFLTLVHLDGRWQIVSKVFHYEVAEA
jgi:hypothetical protein